MKVIDNRFIVINSLCPLERGVDMYTNSERVFLVEHLLRLSFVHDIIIDNGNIIVCDKD